MTLPKLVIAVSILFWILILCYEVLSVAGLIFRTRKKNKKPLERYPSVDVLIPCKNEGKVLFDTLNAMAKIEYPGEITFYILDDNSTDNAGEFADFFESKFKNFKHIRVHEGNPKGKSRVLNYGLTISKGVAVVVFDVDNEP